MFKAIIFYFLFSVYVCHVAVSVETWRPRIPIQSAKPIHTVQLGTLKTRFYSKDITLCGSSIKNKQCNWVLNNLKPIINKPIKHRIDSSSPSSLIQVERTDSLKWYNWILKNLRFIINKSINQTSDSFYYSLFLLHNKFLYQLESINNYIFNFNQLTIRMSKRKEITNKENAKKPKNNNKEVENDSQVIDVVGSPKSNEENGNYQELKNLTPLNIQINDFLTEDLTAGANYNAVWLTQIPGNFQSEVEYESMIAWLSKSAMIDLSQSNHAESTARFVFFELPDFQLLKIEFDKKFPKHGNLSNIQPNNSGGFEIPKFSLVVTKIPSTITDEEWKQAIILPNYEEPKLSINRAKRIVFIDFNERAHFEEMKQKKGITIGNYYMELEVNYLCSYVRFSLILKGLPKNTQPQGVENILKRAGNKSYKIMNVITVQELPMISYLYLSLTLIHSTILTWLSYTLLNGNKSKQHMQRKLKYQLTENQSHLYLTGTFQRSINRENENIYIQYIWYFKLKLIKIFVHPINLCYLLSSYPTKLNFLIIKIIYYYNE
jgi:hypothetical protein